MEPHRTLAERLDRRAPLATRQDALIDLVTFANQALRRFIQGRHIPAHLQEDLCNQTWLIVIQKIQNEGYDCTLGEPLPFIIGIAKKLALRPSPATQHEQAFPEELEVATPDDLFHVADVAIDLAEIAARLTYAEDREVLAAILSERTISEMAQQFDCSYKTAWRRFHRCLDHCRVIATEGTDEAAS